MVKIMVDFKGLQFRDSKSALGVVAANIPSNSVDLESESFRTSSCRRPVSPSTLGRRSLRASLGSLCFRTSFRDAGWPCVGIFFL